MRGAVWSADIPGVGEKPVLIVSSQAVTLKLRPIIARITSVDRERKIDTVVPISGAEVDGLERDSFVICHDLYTLPRGVDQLTRYRGQLTAMRMAQVEEAIAVALALDLAKG